MSAPRAARLRVVVWIVGLAKGEQAIRINYALAAESHVLATFQLRHTRNNSDRMYSSKANYIIFIKIGIYTCIKD
jgi:hypothetical protein